jgi:2-methylcitrate dehydratase PrpD
MVSHSERPAATGTETLAMRQGRWIEALRYEDLPEKVVAKAKLLLLDYLGVARRGATLGHVKPVDALLDLLEPRAAGMAVMGGRRASPPYAAYANATYGHSFEYDDGHFDCGHPGVCVIPAALAVAEHVGADGRALLTAIVAGYQAMAAMMGPINRRTLDIGWHGMKVGGVFGAAAAAGKLLGLSALEQANALAVAASDSSGTMEYDQSGGEVKRFHAGMACRSGVQAAYLARAGLTGPLTIFEGPRGIHNLFSERQPADAEQFWTGEFLIMRTMIKMYPAVGTVHAALDALDMILKRHPATADEIDEIEVGLVYWAIPHGAAIFHPDDMISAQFSLAFACALRVIKGGTAAADFVNPACWRDPAINALCDRVKPVAIEVPDGAHELCGRVTMRYRDGSVEEAFQPAPRGLPQNPPTPADVEAKFRSLAAGILADSGEAVLARVRSVEAMAEVGELWSLLNPGA